MSLLVVQLLYLWLKLAVKNIAPATVFGNTALTVLYLVINLVLWRRDSATDKLKMAIAIEIEIGVEYLLLSAQTDAEFTSIGLMGVMAIQIPYYDKKFYRRLSVSYAVLYTIGVVIKGAKGLLDNDVNGICTIIVTYAIIYVLARVGTISKDFSDHALGSVAEQSGRQKEMI